MAVQRKPIYTAEEKFAKEVIRQAKSNLTRGKKNASRVLYNSLTYKITDDGVEFSFAKEGEFVESGRRKGAKMPPTKPIEKWAKQKGLDQFRDKKGKYLSNKSRAFLIARGISRNGIKPFPFFSDPFERALKTFPDIIAKAVAEVLQEEANKLGT